MRTIHSIQLDGFLSFAPDSKGLELQPLNVVVGPNGSGKSNLIEAFELLRSTSTDFAAAIRAGGNPEEWIWKGKPPIRSASVGVTLAKEDPDRSPLRYRLEFFTIRNRIEIIEEAVEESEPVANKRDLSSYYRFQRGAPILSTQHSDGDTSSLLLLPRPWRAHQSVFIERDRLDRYPEVARVADQFREIQTFRERTFEDLDRLRNPQRADLPGDRLLPDASNLALVLNDIQQRDGNRFQKALTRFAPRFERIGTQDLGDRVLFNVHESRCESPIPATRLSDGTIRFLGILAILLAPNPGSVVCIEHPELGFHPDAVAHLADLLIEASSRMQLVVTTHSEPLLSALSRCPEAVIACEHPGAGTTLHRLDFETLKYWRDAFRVPDRWGVGEREVYR